MNAVVRSGFRVRSAIAGLCGLAVAAVLCGCGGGSNGPERYSLSGNVTFDGQPVVYGNVSITPDTKKGNKGPGAFAQIRDGWYETTSDGGTVGGPHILTVTGMKGVPGSEGIDPDDVVLFDSYELAVDLPKEDTTYDISVPAAAGVPSPARR